VLDDFKSITQIELEEIASSAQNTINNYIEQYESAKQYAESLQTEQQKHDLIIADQQQKVIDAEEKNLILKTANSALEENLVNLHDVERQLATIRSYKLFRLLSLAKKFLRKATGRK
jgi:hypothetical protein